jgi:predicted house-cleaning noncanonical NTP pyrophosphatase (MazG superfamily)
MECLPAYPQATSRTASCIQERYVVNNGKLVRDKIPQIIESKGGKPNVYIADEEEYVVRLRDKLQEEVDEYMGASDQREEREELADILEVLLTLASKAGMNRAQLESVRAHKTEKRGSFSGRIIWTGNG